MAHLEFSRQPVEIEVESVGRVVTQEKRGTLDNQLLQALGSSSHCQRALGSTGLLYLPRDPCATQCFIEVLQMTFHWGAEGCKDLLKHRVIDQIDVASLGQLVLDYNLT